MRDNFNPWSKVFAKSSTFQGLTEDQQAQVKDLRTGLIGMGVSTGSEILGNLGSDGYKSNAGQVFGGIAKMTSQIPGPVGWIGTAAATGLGILSNRGFGVKENKANQALAETTINDLNNYNTDVGSFSELSSLEGPGLLNIGDQFAGKDGWWTHDMRDKSREYAANQAAGVGKVLTGANTTQENLIREDLALRNREYMAKGGRLFSNGGEFSNGITTFNAGGTHEENPLGGIPMGADAQGTPNFVEEGEVLYNDYVYSNRYKLTKEEAKALGVKKGITIADAAKELQKESSERETNVISKNGLDAMMERLMEVQEAKRANDPEVIEAQQEQAVQDALMQQAMQEQALQQQAQQEQEMPVEEMGQMQGIPQEEAMQESVPMDSQNINAEVPQDINLNAPMQGYAKGGKINKLNGKNESQKLNTKLFYNNNGWYHTLPNPWKTYQTMNHYPYFDWKNDDPSLPTPYYATVDDWDKLYSDPDSEFKKRREYYIDKWYDPKFGFQKRGYLYKLGIDNPNLDLSTVTLENFMNITADKKHDMAHYLDAIPSEETAGSLGLGINALPEQGNIISAPNWESNFYSFPSLNSISDNFKITVPYSIKGSTPEGRAELSDMAELEALGRESASPAPKVNFNGSSYSLGPSEEYKNKNKNTTKNPRLYQTWSRYAPVFGSLVGFMQGALSKPDYGYADALMAQAGRAGSYQPVKPTHIGGYLQYNPFDINYSSVIADANSRAQARSLLEASGANPYTATSRLMANNYTANVGRGATYRQAMDSDLTQKRQLAEHARNIDSFNATQDMQASSANAQNAARARALSTELYAKGLAAKQAIDEARNKSINVNLSNFFTSLGAIGKENATFNMANTNPGFTWYSGPSGLNGYKGNSSAKGGNLFEPGGPIEKGVAVDYLSTLLNTPGFIPNTTMMSRYNSNYDPYIDPRRVGINPIKKAIRDHNKKGKFGGGKFKGGGSGGSFEVNTKKTPRTFNEAFDSAKMQGLSTFMFRGLPYNTEEELNPIRELNNRYVGENRVNDGVDSVYDYTSGPFRAGGLELIPIVGKSKGGKITRKKK